MLMRMLPMASASHTACTSQNPLPTFNIALPVGGALSSVGTVALLKRLHHDEHLYMTLVVLLACAFSLANLAPFASIQYFAAVCFGPTRTLQWV